MLLTKTYTPEQVADILQVSKNTVYNLIDRGEIVAKRLGKIYRIPANALAFASTGLDFDLYQAEKEDLKKVSKIKKEIVKARKRL